MTLLILGAASDIGRALARAYAKNGQSIILAARNAVRLADDAADLTARYRVAARWVEFDSLDPDPAAWCDRLGELPDKVICVVGLLGDQPRSQNSIAEADLVMRSNYLGPALFLGELANRMEKRGSGSLIGISSVAGERGRASNYLYGSAKAGFTAFLSGLRNRLAGKGVYVLTVKPGFVATRMTEGMALPKRLTAQPEDVAAAILKADLAGRDILYVKPVWRLIMTVIRAVPEGLFKKLRL